MISVSAGHGPRQLSLVDKSGCGNDILQGVETDIIADNPVRTNALLHQNLGHNDSLWWSEASHSTRAKNPVFRRTMCRNQRKVGAASEGGARSAI